MNSERRNAVEPPQLLATRTILYQQALNSVPCSIADVAGPGLDCFRAALRTVTALLRWRSVNVQNPLRSCMTPVTLSLRLGCDEGCSSDASSMFGPQWVLPGAEVGRRNARVLHFGAFRISAWHGCCDCLVLVQLPQREPPFQNQKYRLRARSPCHQSVALV